MLLSEVKSAKDCVALGGVEHDVQSLTSSLGFLSRAIILACRERLRSSPGDLSPAGYELLKLARDNPGMRQAHAAKFLLIQDSNLANLAKQLVNQGFLERKAAGPSAKRAGLWITEQGGRSLAVFEEFARSVEREITAPLSQAEERALRSCLGKVYKGFL